MTEEMLGRSRAAATAMGLHNVEFRQGKIEARLFEVYGEAFLAHKSK